MADITRIKEHMQVIGADGVHVGTVDNVENDRIKLIKADSGQGSHKGHHHYLPTDLVAEVAGDKVRLSATGANALMFQQEGDRGSSDLITNSSFRRDRLAKSNTSGWDKKRTGMAIAAAGIVSAAGAALVARSRSSKERKPRLQTDENLRLISSEKVEGTAVVDRRGDKIGRIENFMVDKYTGRVAYAVLTFGGTFGIGESLFPLPWSLLTYSEKHDGYVLDITKEQMARAPKFKQSDKPEFDSDYQRSIIQSYRLLLI